jgi:transposase
VKTFGESSFPAMMRGTDKLRQISPDWDLWQKLYYKHPQAYVRQRLLAIKYLWEGKSRPEVTQLLGCNYKSLTKWIDTFLEGGLQKLTQPITHQVPSRLNPEQQLELKPMLLELSANRLRYRQIHLDGENHQPSHPLKMGCNPKRYSHL